MVSIVLVLEELLDYFGKNRAVGHTYAALKGIEKTKGFFIVGFGLLKDWGNKITGKPCSLSLHDIEMGKLRGVRGEPLVFDNSAIQEIFFKTLELVSNLEKEIKTKDLVIIELQESLRQMSESTKQGKSSLQTQHWFLENKVRKAEGKDPIDYTEWLETELECQRKFISGIWSSLDDRLEQKDLLIKQLNYQVDHLFEICKDLASKNENLVLEVSQKIEVIEALSKEIESLSVNSKSLKEIEDLISLLENGCAAWNKLYNEKIEELSQVRLAASKEIRELKVDVASLKEKCNTLSISTSNNYDKAVSNLNRAMQRENVNLIDENAHLISEINSFQKENGRLLVDKNRLERGLSEVENQLESYRKDAESYRRILQYAAVFANNKDIFTVSERVV